MPEKAAAEEDKDSDQEDGGGEGHFGDVIPYVIEATGERVVLKHLRRVHDPKMYEREHKILALFTHPRIVGFRGTWEYKPGGMRRQRGLVMPRAEGSLESYLTDRFERPAGEKWGLALRVARHVAEGLQVGFGPGFVGVRVWVRISIRVKVVWVVEGVLVLG